MRCLLTEACSLHQLAGCWFGVKFSLWACRCDYVDLDVAVFTNILQERVDALGGIAPYLDAQGSLFLKLQDPNRQRAVVNSDGTCLQFLRIRYLSCSRTFETSILPCSPLLWLCIVAISLLLQHKQRQIWPTCLYIQCSSSAGCKLLLLVPSV